MSGELRSAETDLASIIENSLTNCTYLLPIRRSQFDTREAKELESYFQLITGAGCELLVIDGSCDTIFESYHAIWSGVCRHEPVNRKFGYRNDKANGIHTGVEIASGDKIILADDDIRHTSESLSIISELLDHFDVVRPQNYLSPLPWWAKMESARMLINRASLTDGDYPGTCAFRRLTMINSGHYDGDVLFDNEEIIRHFARAGARINYALDHFVQKRPPAFRKWLEQRPRQAYEDFPLRSKTALFFAVLPLSLLIFAIAGLEAGLGLMLFLGLISISLAMKGRARGRAADYFPASSCFWTPLWVLERSMSSWWALYWFLRHGGYPFGGTLLSRGVGRDWFAGGRVAGHNLHQ